MASILPVGTPQLTLRGASSLSCELFALSHLEPWVWSKSSLVNRVGVSLGLELPRGVLPILLPTLHLRPKEALPWGA